MSDDQIRALANEISEKKKQLAELVKARPRVEVPNYKLTTVKEESVHLSDLFGANDEMIVIFNMGKGCSYCTAWADELNGIAALLQSRCPTIIVSPDDALTMRQFANSRGWRLPIFSHRGTSMAKDQGYFCDDDGYWPGFITLQKLPDGKIERVGNDFFGPGDSYCAIWNLFDYLAKGANGWEPDYKLP